MIVCDFMRTNICVPVYLQFQIFFQLVNDTPSSLFSCVAVTASGNQKNSNDYFLYEDPTASVTCFFSLPGNFTQIDALLSFLFSMTDWYSFSYFFFPRETVIFSSPFCISPLSSASQNFQRSFSGELHAVLLVC